MFLCMGEFKNFCMGKWIIISDVLSWIFLYVNVIKFIYWELNWIFGIKRYVVSRKILMGNCWNIMMNVVYCELKLLFYYVIV